VGEGIEVTPSWPMVANGGVSRAASVQHKRRQRDGRQTHRDTIRPLYDDDADDDDDDVCCVAICATIYKNSNASNVVATFTPRQKSLNSSLFPYLLSTHCSLHCDVHKFSLCVQLSLHVISISSTRSC